ncbi:hypothetical protein Lal_00045734 [Lupinus albus]|nr:hypothetical protein Lal_00045734 [Lupinus albus]
MKGDGLSWYKWMFNTNQLTSWEGFTKALLVRFGPSTFHNPQAELFKLRQTSTVIEYQTHFERLSNEVVGLTSEMLLNCFLSGLNSDIARELAIQQPFSLTHAIGLAILVESKITATKSNDWPSTRPAMNIEDPNDTYHNNEHISAVQNNDCWPTIANPNIGIEDIYKGEDNFKKYNLEDKVVFQGLGNVGRLSPIRLLMVVHPDPKE